MAKKHKKDMTPEELLRHRRRRRQWLGAAAAFLVVVGMGTVVYAAYLGFNKMMDNTAEKEYYSELLKPLVMLDPIEFDTLEAAQPETLLQAAIWACLYNEDITQYSRDENGAMILPAVDIDRYGAKLYGSGYALPHETFTAEGMEFKYDEEKACFILPITGQVGNYVPVVSKIKGTFQKVVTVGYEAPAAGGALNITNSVADGPVKYMDYVFTRSDGEYYLTAIHVNNEIAVQSAVSSSTTAPPAPVVDETASDTSTTPEDDGVVAG